MADSSTSSSSTYGRITWQTSMAMSNEGITPPISDSFVSNRWTATQENQGMIKYTQYVETGRDAEASDLENASNNSSAFAAIAMEINGVEKVDFGWLKQPKFVCFTNSTPEGATEATIFIGVENNAARDAVTGSSASALMVPAWFVGEQADLYGDESWSDHSAEYNVSGNLTATQVAGWARTNFCQNVFEIPPGVTIGPIIIPEDVTYWVYKNAATNAEAENSSESTYPGAILITEAYDS